MRYVGNNGRHAHPLFPHRQPTGLHEPLAHDMVNGSPGGPTAYNHEWNGIMKRHLGLFAAGTVYLCATLGALHANSPQDTPPVVVKGTTVHTVQMSSSYSAPQASSAAPSTGSPPPGARPPGARPPGSAGKEGASKSHSTTRPGTPPTGKPGTPGAEGKPPTTIKRNDKQPGPADAKEFDVRPGLDGIVHFQFRGQNWPDVLDWYAHIAGASIDWQELPGDYLNISTQRGYTVTQIGALLNRLLLARGFTMLPQEEFINVVKCEDLTTALVPRVRREDLGQLGQYEFVRVMFALDWMLASEAITELEPLLSKNGKLFSLKTTNRIEAMDAVGNLREIDQLLTEEQRSEGGTSRLVREFVLRYVRADDARESLSQFLGISSSSTTPSTRGMSSSQLAKQQQMMMQMQQQMQQRMAAQQRSSSSSSRKSRVKPTMPTKEAPIRLMVNRRRNSLLVQAPPDKMATIAEAVKLMDVPEQGAASLQAYLGRMQVYRLTQLDPQKLVTSLRELGGLDPSTRLEVDETNRAIIAYATVADHYTIRTTVEKLDGSARRVEVIPLRHLAADEVAGTIQYLMVGTSQQSSSRPDYMGYGYGYGYGYSSRRSRNEPSGDKFRIDADVENNRLLVRANDMELEEVVSILVKLGEVPQVGRDGDTTRVLDIAPGADAEAFLQQLQRDFKALAPNQLVLPQQYPKKEAKTSAAPKRTPGAPRTAPADKAPADKAPADKAPKTAAAASPSGLFHTALFQQPIAPREEQTQRPASSPTRQQTRAQQPAEPTVPQNSASQDDAPPIIVSIGPDGRLVLSSRDPRALELLEQLAIRTAPPSKDYHIFQLKYASASWIVLNLEDFFEDKDDKENERRNRMSWMFGMPQRSSQGDQRKLSKRKPLKFITDLDTNTILVQGADAGQLKTIADLIELYDVPEPVNSQNARVTKLFTVKYSRASIVADTIKDAYRDLLSSNDRALQNGKKEKSKQPRGGGMTVISAFGLGSDPTPADSRTSARFEGKLSIGVEDLSNTLLVSTEGENLMSVVASMIEALDEAAKPVSDVQVIKVSTHVDGSRLQSVLEKVLKAQSRPGLKAPQRKSQPGQPTSARGQRGNMGKPQGSVAAPRR